VAEDDVSLYSGVAVEDAASVFRLVVLEVPYILYSDPILCRPMEKSK
jgi:hypothetical protein